MNEQETIKFILENSSEPVIKNPILQAALREPRPMAQGGRVGYKPGGIVEPGVMYYGKSTVDDLTQSVKAGEELGENITQTKKGYHLQMGHGDNRITRHRKSLAEVKAYKDQVISEGWKKKTAGPKSENLFKDPLFEQFFTNELNKNDKLKKAIVDLPENATLKEKWDHLTGKHLRGHIKSKFNKVYKRDLGYLNLDQLSDFTQFKSATLQDAFYHYEKYKGVMPDITKVTPDKYSKAKRAVEIVDQLKEIGITKQNVPGTYRSSPTGKFKGILAKALFNLPDDDQIIKLRNMNKLKGEQSPTTRAEITKASKNSPEYLKMEYGKDRGNMNKLLKTLNASFADLDEVELKKLIKNNPALEEMVTSRFNASGDIVPGQLDDLTFNEIKNRIGFEREHVRSLKTVKIDPITKEMLDGLDIEYPKNLRITIKGFNNPFKESAEKWVQGNIKNIKDPLIKGKIDKIDNFFTKFGQAYSIVDPTTNTQVVRGAAESNLLKNIQALGFKEEVFDPKLLANIEERTLKNLQEVEVPCIKGEGGQCNRAKDYKKGFNELVQKGAAGDKAAVSKLKKFTNLMKIAKGPLKWTGYGILGEIGFMVPFGVADYTTGESWKRIMGNASDWGFGPMFGQSEDEEIIANLPEGSLGAEYQEALAASKRLKALENPNRNFPKGRIGMDPQRFQKAQAKVIPDAALDYRNKLTPFMEGPRDEFFNPNKAAVAKQDVALTKQQIAEQKKQRIEERRERGFIAEEGWEKNVRRVNRMEGGRVGLAKGSKGPKDPSKRLFIKGVAAASMIPILGKYFKLAKPAAKAVGQYTGPVIEKIKGLEWVQFLAKRLWDEGADVTETAARQEREIVRRGTLESGDEVDMVYNLDSGDVRFEVSPIKGSRQTSGGAYNDPYSLDYKAPQVIDEGKQAGTKIKSQIEVAESTPRQVSPDDVELDGDYASVDDAISDLTELEAFAKKKLTKEIHKKKGTKPKKTSPDFEGPEPDLDDYASGGRVSYFDGGIVSLKKKW